MLTEYQKAKLIKWAEWMEVQPNDGVMPYGVGMVRGWAMLSTEWYEVNFPTAEQMEPTPADFGLEQ